MERPDDETRERRRRTLERCKNVSAASLMGRRNVRGKERGRPRNVGLERQNQRGQSGTEEENNPKRQRKDRPPRKIGYLFIKQLTDSEDIEKIILDLSNDRNGFRNLLESNEIKEDVIVLVVTLVWQICQSTFLQNKIALLTTVLESRFMEKLTCYITSLLTQSQRDKKFNAHFWDNPDEFWIHLLCICKNVRELIPSRSETVLKLLTTLDVYMKLIEETHSIHIADQIKTQTKDSLEMIKKTITDLEVKKTEKVKRVFEEDEEPPDDFRLIPIIPSVREVLDHSRPFLRKNIIDRPYRDVEQYLDIQFRLLREDFMLPLRKGIQTYLDNQSKPKEDRKKMDDIKIYSHVRFISAEIVNECHSYKIMYDCAQKKRSFNYENSKRFMFGSLVCFTCNNFASLLFGKIVKRDVKDLEKGFLTVGFEEQVQINLKADYVMVESNVYFEPYFHVLNVLQTMSTENFPMEKYIIKIETTLNPPRYLMKQEPVNYNINGFAVQALNLKLMPDRRFYGLNESQSNAFKAALTDEFSIIQGPPGTGKTFLGLKIAHTLLQNEKVWYKKTPMLVICYTNHALDQFLEGILQVTQNILRVGSQSKNEQLQKYNLIERRKAFNVDLPAAVFQRKLEVNDLIAQVKSLEETLNLIETNESVVEFCGFRDLVEDYGNSWFSKAKNKHIVAWLMEGKYGEPLHVLRQREAVRVAGNGENLNIAGNENADDDGPMIDVDEHLKEEWLDDVFDNINVKRLSTILSKKQLQEKLTSLREEMIHLANSQDENLQTMLLLENINYEIWDVETELQYLTDRLSFYNDPRNRLRPNHVDMQNPFKMHYEDRWRLYYCWLNQYVVQLRRQKGRYSRSFRQVYRVYSEMRDMGDAQIMKKHLVVGMTTTGAARLQRTIQALRSPIVIVEEAAEVLESHIVASLSNDCQHLILIGDHLQLKPGAASYRIETTYKLGISLFERMVRNKIMCHTLNVQHRMRPEIAQLIKPHIYPNLLDHKSTLERLPILGIEKPVYFINHQKMEEQCQDASKKNIHESKFLIALARHLVLNGYKPEQITILVAYLGQFFEMRREKNLPQNRLLLQDVRISVLDNYQGEESDIILLSLVRSNDANSAGFLKIQNRVCVALSRARDGFYITGNMNLLLKCNSENQIWDKVNAVLTKQNAIGTHLSLRCQIHRHKITQVAKAEDFNMLSEGGCDILCEVLLRCGHNCKRLCHILDRNHAEYKCAEKCTRLLCNDETHVCRKPCFEPCGPCIYLVRRHLEKCGHDVDVECQVDMNTYKCVIKEPVTLPCNHKTLKPCHADPVTFQCLFNCDTRVEPCGHACTRKCHIREDPDHLNYRCPKPCAKPKIGCKNEEEKHICSKYCWQDCEECLVEVPKIRSCEHQHIIGCNVDVESIECRKPCKRQLACGHRCKKQCYEDCEPCNMPVDKTIPECNHVVKVACHKIPTRLDCTSKKCPRKLPCGHNCKNSCKDDCTTKCVEMADCDLLTPCVHKINRVLCYLKNTENSEKLLEHCTHPCGVELKCGHKCTGTCGECMQSRIHKRCSEKCGVLLVCNHECLIPCRESCKPCTRPCEIRCKHSNCKKKCGEPCTPCKQPCPRNCKHVTCRKLCGEICNVAPCKERCRKKLKCGHGCVGFCGDKCPPLCRRCDKETLTEIFFGTEDEDDAVFVYLNDCKHVLEHTGLEEWLNQGGNKIEFKVCPKCKTNITTTERYSDYTKRALHDVIHAKQLTFGYKYENEEERTNLIKDLAILVETCEKYSTDVYNIFMVIFDVLEQRLYLVRRKRNQSINKVELNAIKSKVQTLTGIVECFKGWKSRIGHSKDFDLCQKYLLVLRDVLMRSEDHVTNQEIDDMKLEIKRLHRILQFSDISDSGNYLYLSSKKPEVIQLRLKIELKLFAKCRYSDADDNLIENELKNLAHKIGLLMEVTREEKIEIVNAIGLTKGHWFKCPNGHPYAIGECGGAMQVAKCFCGEAIGGSNHHLLPTNQFAGDMDGADRHAWPGGLH